MAIPNESDKWVLTPEGYAVPDGGGWKRHVYVRDVQGNIRAVVGEDNAVAEQTDYYPYGMPMADVNSSSAQPFKFGGKELEREGGTDFYDFEARRLDFALGRFTSPDPLCEQTPEVSPYAYCAADPVNFIDPTGMTIYVNGTLYTIGMEYKGDESFTRQIVTILNLIAENGGKKLLQDLQTSSKQYNYFQSKNRQTFATPTRDSSGKYTGTNMYIATDGYNEATVTGSVAHESMHAAQYEHGVGGPYIINEVEAYGFEGVISDNIMNYYCDIYGVYNGYQSWNSLYSYSTGQYNMRDLRYDKLVTNYIYKPYSIKNEILLCLFFSKSQAYNSSKYSGYGFFPLKRLFAFKRPYSLFQYYTEK